MERRRFLGVTGLAVLGATTAGPSQVHAQEPQWRPDGVGLLGRLGVLTPDFDPVPESEISVMAPAGISIHTSRVPRDRNRTPAAFAEPPHVDDAVERLVELAPRAIVFAYTGSSYMLGPDADSRTRARLETRVRGIPVVLTCPAATDALRALGAKRVALIHPPWFSEEVNAKGMEYFRIEGFQVLQCARMTPARSFSEVRPAELYDYVRANTPNDAQAVFISGNGLRAIGVIGALEVSLRRPVLTANQVALWAALRVAKLRADIGEYGRIFSTNS